jgi:transketolase
MTPKFVKEKLGEPQSIAAGTEKGLITAASKNQKILIVLNDLGSPGLNWFLENAPKRVIELGIAEANGAVVAAGLASEGYMPFWHTFGFCIGRAYNQIRQSICIDRFNVKMLFMGGLWGQDGISHLCFEDIAAMRALPNMVIVVPADAVEAEKALLAITDYVGPVYYRIEGLVPPFTPLVFEDGYEFELGKAATVREGSDASIIACGTIVAEALMAAELLKKDGIDARVIDMSTIKPLDEETVIKAAKETGCVITAENHSIIGGLGEAVGTVLAENNLGPLARIGVRDEFGQSAIDTPDCLKTYLNLSYKDIAAKVAETLKKKR